MKWIDISKRLLRFGVRLNIKRRREGRVTVGC